MMSHTSKQSPSSADLAISPSLPNGPKKVDFHTFPGVENELVWMTNMSDDWLIDGIKYIEEHGLPHGTDDEGEIYPLTDVEKSFVTNKTLFMEARGDRTWEITTALFRGEKYIVLDIEVDFPLHPEFSFTGEDSVSAAELHWHFGKTCAEVAKKTNGYVIWDREPEIFGESIDARYTSMVIIPFKYALYVAGEDAHAWNHHLNLLMNNAQPALIPDENIPPMISVLGPYQS